MKRVLVAAAVAMALAGPAAVSAQTPPATAKDTTTKAASSMATMVCRPAAASEKPTAMMMGSNTPIVCKQIPAVMKDGKFAGGPDLSKALTPEQANAAWQAWVTMTYNIPTGGG